MDDTIDEEGFAKSRLVVGSVESDVGSFLRQESQGSLSGRSVDLDVPMPISEDVFHEEQDRETHLEVVSGQESECLSQQEADSPRSVLSVAESCDRRTSVPCSNSEAHTPDSIVVLTSESNSPDEAVCSTSVTAEKMKHMVTCGPLKPSPISSPDSIEVLGSSSLLTSPSSIEVTRDQHLSSASLNLEDL